MPIISTLYVISDHDFQGLGTNEQLLLEVLLTRSFEDLQVVKAAYEKRT